MHPKPSDLMSYPSIDHGPQAVVQKPKSQRLEVFWYFQVHKVGGKAYAANGRMVPASWC